VIYSKLDPQNFVKFPWGGKGPEKTLVEPASAIFDTLRRGIPKCFFRPFPSPGASQVRRVKFSQEGKKMSLGAFCWVNRLLYREEARLSWIERGESLMCKTP
jgi:hypothetical protein